MPRAVVAFTQADVARAVKGAAAAGMSIARLEIDPATGRIILLTAAAAPAEPQNEFDRWKADRDARSS